jgi:hypothetical protein
MTIHGLQMALGYHAKRKEVYIFSAEIATTQKQKYITNITALS